MLKNIRIWLHNNQTILKILLYLYFLLLTWLLLRASTNAGSFVYGFISSIYNDKVAHACSFFILFMLGRFAYPTKKPLFFIIVFTFYGVLIEFLQKYMGLGRTFEYYDILADFIGCLLGLLLARITLGMSGYKHKKT